MGHRSLNCGGLRTLIPEVSDQFVNQRVYGLDVWTFVNSLASLLIDDKDCSWTPLSGIFGHLVAQHHEMKAFHELLAELKRRISRSLPDISQSIAIPFNCEPCLGAFIQWTLIFDHRQSLIEASVVTLNAIGPLNSAREGASA